MHSATVAVAGLGKLERLGADLDPVDGEADPKASEDTLAPVADELAAIAAAQPRDRLFWFGGDDDDSVARTWWGACHSVEPAPAYEPTATAFVRCFRRDSPLYWLQGHAVWHVLTMGALACIYWFFRSERLVD